MQSIASPEIRQLFQHLPNIAPVVSELFSKGFASIELWLCCPHDFTLTYVLVYHLNHRLPDTEN